MTALQLALGFVVTLGATFPLRWLALRVGILDHPGPRKAHSKPVPYLGGLAVLAGAGAALLAFGPGNALPFALMALVCILGLFDDIWHARVATKLVAEVSVALAAAGLGFVWQLTDSVFINTALSVVWMVGITNSFNLLDNMDGLASTVATASLLAMALIVPATAPLAAPLAAAAAGFLVVNRPPARMYLGDAGSLTVGFGAALVSITAANTAHGLHSLVLLAAPVAVPVFDTSLVIVSRVLAGRPVQLGGRDHFSHRLLQLGWSRPLVLLAALAVSGTASTIGYLAVLYPGTEAWLAVPIAVLLVGGWLRLLKIDPYTAEVKFTPEVLSDEAPSQPQADAPRETRKPAR